MVMLSRAADEAIRAAHEKHRAAQPVAPVQVRNAQALVALGEHRPLRWRGHRYQVPPVPFRAGAQLLVVSQIIVQAAAVGGGREGERALSVGRTIMHALVRRRRFGRWGKPLRNPFRDASPAEVLEKIDWFLDVPDESKPGGGAKPKVVDLMHGFMDAARAFPFIIDPSTGLPHSWAHYQHALRSVGRVMATEALSHAQAARVGVNADKDGWKQYTGEMRRVAELN